MKQQQGDQQQVIIVLILGTKTCLGDTQNFNKLYLHQQPKSELLCTRCIFKLKRMV